MTPPATHTPTELMTLFVAARSAALALRLWIIERYGLTAIQLDVAMATTLPQLDAIARFDRYYGYNITPAPVTLREPIRTYTHALRCGRKPRSHAELPQALLRAHRRIVRLVEGPSRGRHRD
ncbi:hypothetical protein AD953_10665 [Acetobacter malorum]|uniref:Uncharacterized protein n=1 Tax=Acetobacter malorum TaxID=178901 RepID=A0A149V348_9PROT|nr:hypothetical protein [Acetobacter malorum]KXV74680.1 hypothetical protein AD953_10665 [Acetobacter malorum]